MRLEDQNRFQIEAGYDGEPVLFLSCTRCQDWTRIITDVLNLAELDDLAEPHAEVCR